MDPVDRATSPHRRRAGPSTAPEQDATRELSQQTQPSRQRGAHNLPRADASTSKTWLGQYRVTRNGRPTFSGLTRACHHCARESDATTRICWVNDLPTCPTCHKHHKTHGEFNPKTKVRPTPRVQSLIDQLAEVRQIRNEIPPEFTKKPTERDGRKRPPQGPKPQRVCPNCEMVVPPGKPMRKCGDTKYCNKCGLFYKFHGFLRPKTQGKLQFNTRDGTFVNRDKKRSRDSRDSEGDSDSGTISDTAGTNTNTNTNTNTGTHTSRRQRKIKWRHKSRGESRRKGKGRMPPPPLPASSTGRQQTTGDGPAAFDFGLRPLGTRAPTEQGEQSYNDGDDDDDAGAAVFYDDDDDDGETTRDGETVEDPAGTAQRSPVKPVAPLTAAALANLKKNPKTGGPGYSIQKYHNTRSRSSNHHVPGYTGRSRAVGQDADHDNEDDAGSYYSYSYSYSEEDDDAVGQVPVTARSSQQGETTDIGRGVPLDDVNAHHPLQPHHSSRLRSIPSYQLSRPNTQAAVSDTSGLHRPIAVRHVRAPASVHSSVAPMTTLPPGYEFRATVVTASGPDSYIVTTVIDDVQFSGTMTRMK